MDMEDGGGVRTCGKRADFQLHIPPPHYQKRLQYFQEVEFREQEDVHCVTYPTRF